jgi:hypothetical protein
MIKYTPGGIKPEPAAARADAPANNVTEAESKKGFFSKLFGK